MEKQTMITSESIKNVYEILTKYWNEPPKIEYLDEAFKLAKTWGDIWCPMFDVVYATVRLHKSLDTVYEVLNLLGIDVEGERE
jgi:hypothetical protein